MSYWLLMGKSEDERGNLWGCVKGGWEVLVLLCEESAVMS